MEQKNSGRAWHVVPTREVKRAVCLNRNCIYEIFDVEVETFYNRILVFSSFVSQITFGQSYLATDILETSLARDKIRLAVYHHLDFLSYN